MPQLLAIPALGLPALNNDCHDLVFVLYYVRYGCEPPSVQAHGEDIITVRCPVNRLSFGNVLYFSVFYEVGSQDLLIQLYRDITHGDSYFTSSHVLWLKPEVLGDDIFAGQLGCKVF